ncbi:MAG: 16S rRNA (guanine(966)-N(2))-methyltransferase RsmD [Chloroflexota bacterium]
MSGLRIISGKARGRKIRPVPGDITRPITDRAKESLFNILQMDVPGSTWLDLFAGTGAVGIEALSREAEFVRFVDVNRQAIETVRANLTSTDLKAGAEVIRMDAFTLLSRSPDRNFDYIFIAPPQYKGLWKRALLDIDANPQWLTPTGWVIVQIHPVEYENIELSVLVEFDQRRYGSTLFIFYQLGATH